MSPVPVPSDAVLKPGALILITGVTGYIGAHVADQLLQRGYRVRGVVRKPSEWLVSVFDQKYGKDAFTTYFVEDVSKEELLVPALQDVQGVVHVASDVSFSPDPNVVIPIAVNLATAALKAASRSPSVQRFVITSSSAAASAYTPGRPRTINADSWAEDFVEESKKPGPYTAERGMSTYGASKVLAERAAWQWAKENEGKTDIIVNAVLPDWNCGLPISPENQGWPSSVGIAKALFDGNEQWGRLLPAQQFIAVQDTALLHLAALLRPDVKNERVFGFAEPKNNNQVLDVYRELYPERTFIANDPSEAEDMTTVTEKPRAEELLQWIAGRSWVTMKDSLKEIGDYFVAHGEKA